MTTTHTDTPVFELSLDADAENLLIVRQAFEGLADSLSMSVPQRDDLKLAITEACTNVIKYAYGDESGTMRLVAYVAATHLKVAVSDVGRWKEPGTPGAPDEPGHGLSVIEAICADLTIDRDDEGTTVNMTFELSGAAATE